MQGLVLQLTRVGFLLLLWLFIWSVLRILRTDIYAPTGAVMVRRGLALRGSLLPSRGRRSVVRQLVVGLVRRGARVWLAVAGAALTAFSLAGLQANARLAQRLTPQVQ